MVTKRDIGIWEVVVLVVIIEKETFIYGLQVYWKNVEVYIADTNK